MTDEDEKNKNPAPNPQRPINKRVNPKKRAPTTLQQSNDTAKYTDLSVLLIVIFSFLLIVVVSFLTFGGVLIHTGMYFLQLGQIKKSTEAATKAANAAEASVKQVRKAAHRDQRAWVAVVDIQGVPEIGTIFSVNVAAQNSGKTFAKNVAMRAVIELVTEKGREPDFTLDDSAAARKDSSVSLLAPNADYLMDIELRKQTPPHEITQSDLDGIRRGDLTIFIHGKITYDDIFGCTHWSSFCTRLKPDLKYASYGKHNDADQNHCP
jgi:hypothetical protein